MLVNFNFDSNVTEKSILSCDQEYRREVLNLLLKDQEGGYKIFISLNVKIF